MNVRNICLLCLAVLFLPLVLFGVAAVCLDAVVRFAMGEASPAGKYGEWP